MSETLRAREAALKSALAEKDMLLREVNHRVKNSLQLVSSLFGLHRTEIKDPEARSQFMNAANRVSTVAKVHQRLYQGSNVYRVEFGQYLRDLCGDLSTALARGSGQELICRAEECDLPTDQVVPLALIVNELITNAFKYAVQDRPGKVEVSWGRTADGSLELVVRDDGPGMKEGIVEGQASGLGLRLVNALARQLHAKLDIETSHQGTVFSLAMMAK
jgi:two-component sensor histidine kinase